jgi:hypothetical protein
MKRATLLVAVGVTVLLALVVGAALATPPKTADVQFLRPEDRLNDVMDGPS